MSTSTNEYLNQTRKKLVASLGDKKESYFFHMKQWFRMRITKEEFDSNARALLSHDSIHLHNEFLLAILTKCQLFSSPPIPMLTTIKTEPMKLEDRFDALTSSTPGQNQMQYHSTHLSSGNAAVNDRKKIKPKRKAKFPNGGVETPLEIVYLHESAPTASLRDPGVIAETNAGYHSRSLHMLDSGPLKGRLLLAAWDYGLSSVCEDVAMLLHEAVKQCVKNVLSAVISRRKGYRLREKRFMHSFGTVPPNPWLRNSASLIDWSCESLGMPLGEDLNRRPAWPTVEAAEQNAAQLASCAPPVDQPLQPLSAYDLFITLQLDRSTIPCHSVYSMSMERISARLWQPSWSDLEQEAIYAKEQSLKDSIREQRLASNTVT